MKSLLIVAAAATDAAGVIVSAGVWATGNAGVDWAAVALDRAQAALDSVPRTQSGRRVGLVTR